MIYIDTYTWYTYNQCKVYVCFMQRLMLVYSRSNWNISRRVNMWLPWVFPSIWYSWCVICFWWVHAWIWINVQLCPEQTIIAGCRFLKANSCCLIRISYFDKYTLISTGYSYSGWWFGTFFIFPYIWNVLIPVDVHIFQRGLVNHQPDIIRLFKIMIHRLSIFPTYSLYIFSISALSKRSLFFALQLFGTAGHDSQSCAGCLGAVGPRRGYKRPIWALF